MPLFAEVPDVLIAVGIILAAVAVLVGVASAVMMSVARAVNRHLGRHWKQATVLTRPMLNWERVNLFLALERSATRRPAPPPSSASATTTS